MKNYVLLYHFEDQGTANRFENQINQEFRRHQVEENGEFRYFGFADREEPGVVDKLNTILNPMGMGMKDYVALYHSKDENPDKIKRTMLLGHDSLVETKVENMSFDAHRNSLTKLLDFDYVKDQSEPPNK
jgi:hypothetical protein